MKIDEKKLKDQIEIIIDYGAMNGEECDVTLEKVMQVLQPLIIAVKELKP